MRQVRFKSTADYATAEIRQLILSGALPPGSRLDQVELAKRLDVSRHPVRQAIERLAERGFVTVTPHRSAVVAEISSDDMKYLYVVRRALEPLAIREAFPAYDDGLASRAAELHQAMQRAADAMELDAFMESNRMFHLALWASCKNPHLVRTVESLFDLSERYQRTSLAQPGRMQRSNRDHLQMVEALEARNVERLIELISEHNELTKAAVDSKLNSQKA
ncbi:MAG TPA: GntR family transcriptional regulator [Xanthobacteraceae bacterium]|nr:GntR family transcriptional regulator [Xanthobacteraceae bacterium]